MRKLQHGVVSIPGSESGSALQACGLKKVTAKCVGSFDCKNFLRIGTTSVLSFRISTDGKRTVYAHFVAILFRILVSMNQNTCPELHALSTHNTLYCRQKLQQTRGALWLACCRNLSKRFPKALSHLEITHAGEINDHWSLDNQVDSGIAYVLSLSGWHGKRHRAWPVFQFYITAHTTLADTHIVYFHTSLLFVSRW